MLFSRCFAPFLVLELPLPASAAVGGGGRCWRGVRGPDWCARALEMAEMPGMVCFPQGVGW